MIIVHYTGMKSAHEAIRRLCDPQAEVSAHYVIEENGRLHQLVEDEMRAWHAGKSFWAGEADINSHSIGIELVNPGHEFGYRPFQAKQLQKLKILCKFLIQKWNIPPMQILGHSDIAPGRKQDPGELFPWQDLAQEGIGLWPSPNEMDYQAAEDIILRPESVRELLVAFGYNDALEDKILIEAFHRHFYPEKLLGSPDILSIAKLLSLLRLKHET